MIFSSTDIFPNEKQGLRPFDFVNIRAKNKVPKNSKVVNLASSLRVCAAGRATVVPGRPRPTPLSRPVMVGQDHVQTFCQDRGDYVHKCQDSFSNTR